MRALLTALEHSRIDSSVECIAQLLEACSQARSLATLRNVHSLLRKRGCDEREPQICARLIAAYIKLRSYAEAEAIFERMPSRGAPVSSLMIAANAQRGDLQQALRLFRWMQLDGIAPDASTYRSLVNACAGARSLDPRLLPSIRARIEQQGLDRDVGICNAMIQALGRTGRIDDAARVFREALRGSRTLVSWTAMVAVYARNGQRKESLQVFREMLAAGVLPDYVAFVSVIEACGDAIAELRFVHALIRSRGFHSGLVIGNALVAMYGRCGDLASARAVFQEMASRDIISWNSMLQACSRNRRGNEALELFEAIMRDYAAQDRQDLQRSSEDYRDPVVPSAVTFIAVLEACSWDPALLEEGKKIDELLATRFPDLARDLTVATALVTMYSKCGAFDRARQAFDRVDCAARDAVLWTAIITAASDHGRHHESIHFFRQMLQLRGAQRKNLALALVTVLNSCAALPSTLARTGRAIHAWTIEYGLESVTIGTALVHMYGACGSLRDARGVFDRLRGARDSGIWNAMVAAYARDGHSDEALGLFQGMENEGVDVDSITFVGILAACSHAGMLDLGCEFFARMLRDHELQPSVEHCGCVTDLLGRAGWLDEARAIARGDLVAPNTIVLYSLLGACKVHGDLELGKSVMRDAKEHGRSSAPYVMLAGMVKLWS